MTERPTRKEVDKAKAHFKARCNPGHEYDWNQGMIIAAECRALEQELAALKIEHNGPCDSYGLCLQCAARLEHNTDLLKALTLAQAELAASKERIETLEGQVARKERWLMDTKNNFHDWKARAEKSEKENKRLMDHIEGLNNLLCLPSPCHTKDCEHLDLSTPATAPQKAGEGDRGV